MKKCALYFFLLLSSLISSFAFAQNTLKAVPLSRAEISASFAPLVKKAAPAVVNIYSRKKTLVHLSPFFNDPFFKQFLGEEFQGGVRQRVESSLGSGVILKSNGLIITNYHVVKDSDEITVILADRREFQAKILLKDEKVDLALLQIDAQNDVLPYLLLQDSDTVEVGDLVLAIGNPFGVGQTVTSGIVSALARTTVGVSDFQSFIQTDAAINPGNSGGALVTMDGKLAGVNTAIYSSSGGSNGVGFAIPSNMVATIVDSVTSGKVKSGHIIRPWFGAATQPVTKDIALSMNLKSPIGVLVSQIYPGGPASRGGLQAGDIIVAVSNHETNDEGSLRFRIATSPIGQAAQFKIIRTGQPLVLEVMMEAPPELPARDSRRLRGQHPLAGATVANLSPALDDELNLSLTQRGVVVLDTTKEEYAARLGIEKGDIIKAVNTIPMESTRQLEAYMPKQKQGWNIVVQRGDKLLNVAVR
jgi:Do/DeqQ family serine protease